MDCVGIFMSTQDMRKVFNADLMMRKGWAVVNSAAEDTDPEELRQAVEDTAKKEDPHVVVRFIDPETQEEYSDGVEPMSDYALVFVADAPFFASGASQ